jgi:polysaccharide biosynthesis protein PslG
MKTKNILTSIIVLIVVLCILLALDLTNRGLFWQFAWSVTGEEEPAAQLRALPQWLMSYSRVQPDTKPLVAVDHTNEIPYGINTFLQTEAEQPKIEVQLQMISEAGFVWLRQEFPWEDLEVDGRGKFTDSRNDMNRDGIMDASDTIDSFAKYDFIVDMVEKYGLRLQVRLSNPPNWSRSEPPEVSGTLAPPDDYQDYVNYAVAVAERYKGRITHYQIWNEPNIYPEWGESPADPEGYTEMLCRTYEALKQVDPNIVVISGAMAPTVALDGMDLNDYIFLQRMYDAGAGDCFDILSAQGYGLFSGPTDHRMRPTTINVAHHIYLRDIMVANGDDHKPIWISEAAWNFVPSAEEVPDIANREMFGQVTQQQAADYMPLLYQRAQEEWPWVGVVNYWFFTRSSPAESNQPMYYFRMVEPDYNGETHPTFTPLPVYDEVKAYISTNTATLYKGVHQADDHWAITVDDTAKTVEDENAQFGQALEATTVEFVADGTDIIINWRGDDKLSVYVDGELQQTIAGHITDWRPAHISLSMLSGTHDVQLMTYQPFQLDSITVFDRSWKNVFPYLVILFAGLLLLVLSIRDGIMQR